MRRLLQSLGGQLGEEVGEGEGLGGSEGEGEKWVDLREMLEGESAMFADGLSMHILIFFLFNFGCAGSS